MKIDIKDTIAAISTSPGEAGIGIVRLSGAGALKVADKVFLSNDGKKPSGFKTYTLHYGWIIDGSESNVVDEVILNVMRAPRSYTKEDVVEINCHGGIIALRRVLDLVLDSGCRLAEPGEFTRRAFLNGRIDLSQAEAVLEIIRAKTDAALKLSQEQLKGVLSKEISKKREVLLDALAHLEANIDFPEEEIGMLELGGISKSLKQVEADLDILLNSAKQARALRDGVHTVIVGKPNVGKSSLLNALLKEERSIVTAIAGTTRDTIEEIIDIKGIPIRIVDTAGLLEPRDLVERRAVQRSKKHLDLADLVILLFDASKKLDKADKALLKKLKGKKVIAVLNKMDLKSRIERDKIAAEFQCVIDISAKKLQNINLLEDAIADLVCDGKVNISASQMLTGLRQVSILREARKSLKRAIRLTDDKLSPELIAQDLKETLACLDDMLGRRFSDDLLDKIFTEFCIGK